jgi:hypothetical protein
LNANQFNTLNRAHQNAFLRYQQQVNSLNPNLTEQQRMAALQQLQAQFNADLSGTVNTTLTNPQTLNRFNQLNRQFMGFNAFNDPTVRQQLGLTQEQLSRIRALSNDTRQQLQQFRRGAGNDLSSVNMEQWNQLWGNYSTQLNSILTPQQRQLWTQQVGQPFVFSPSTMLNQGNFGEAPAPVVDPTVPRFVPHNPSATGRTTTGTTTQGTAPGTAQPTTGGTTGTAGAAGSAGTSGTTTQGSSNTGTATTQGTTPQGGTVR